MKKEKSSLLGLYTIGIAALFLAGFLLLVVFGARTYQNTVLVQNDNNTKRAMISYLAACGKAGEFGKISVSESGDGPVLVIEDGDTGYAQRIFLHDGKLMEDYNRTQAPVSGEQGQVIGETGIFKIHERSGSVLEIETDAGRVLIDTERGEKR